MEARGSLQSWGAKVWRKWRQQQVREEFREVKGEGADPGGSGRGVRWVKEAGVGALGGTRGPERLTEVRLH